MRILWVRLLLSAVCIIAAGAVAFATSTPDMMLAQLRHLTPAIVAAICLGTVFTTLVAAARLQFVAADLGHPVHFRDCVAAVAVGQAAGHLLMQFFGQLFARSAILGRSGMPVEASMSATLYERVVALLVALLFAVPGSLYVFGRLTIDTEHGGMELIDLAVGLGLACAAAGVIVLPLARPFLRHFDRVALLRGARSFGLTFVIHGTTLLVFVLSAAALAPQVAMLDLVASAAVVMFAAALPISFAGWGVRELSAVAALGAVGVPPEAALLSALAVGVLSLIVVGAMSAAAPWLMTGTKAAPERRRIASGLDLDAAFAWTISLAVAVLIFFQVHVPVDAGRVNVSLGDPLAIVAGLVALVWLVRGRLDWRVSHFHWHLALVAVVLAVGLLHGAAVFGWTRWAAVNKTMGWFVLAAYVGAGALIVKQGGWEGWRTLARVTVVVAAAGIAFDLVKMAAAHAGYDVVSLTFGRLDGFGQDPNAFAFQLILAVALLFCILPEERRFWLLAPVLMTGLWFTGSRSGLGAMAIVVVIAVALRPVLLRRVTVTIVAAVVLAGLCTGMQNLASAWRVAAEQALPAQEAIPAPAPESSASSQEMKPEREPRSESAEERWKSIATGWQMFLDHPVFGAGLGYFNAHVRGLDDRLLVIHSSPLWLLAEMGLVGFAAFLWPAVRMFKAEWQPARHGDDVALLVVLTLVGFAVMSTVQDLLYQRALWFVLGAAMASTFAPASRFSEAVQARERVARVAA